MNWHVVRIVPTADGSWRPSLRPDTALFERIVRPKRDRAEYMRRYRALNGRPSRAKVQQ